ncbi:hypothetical protein BDQ12DRAFT_237507 [Crucibulum laeve]|uniref:Uncharacterized protein n=1 Tax=Crucibulum laeve TaxID=68775 RepID=A0A5C3LUM8_9AGAR|nr:hypothetical protein BDQ12DRAFT_237507 [Crucibulum laeve]
MWWASVALVHLPLTTLGIIVFILQVLGFRICLCQINNFSRVTKNLRLRRT